MGRARARGRGRTRELGCGPGRSRGNRGNRGRDSRQRSGNPERTYTALNHESPEFVRFLNPGDLRVAVQTCGGCHVNEVGQLKRSLMTTSAMLMGGAAYNNGIVPAKRYILGESYSPD